MQSPILIVGAGPTGLVLALFLKRHGVAFRIVDQARGPGEQSRALAVQARTLEFYDQLGLADRAVNAGTRIAGIRMREAGKEVAHVPLGDLGGDISPYPFILCLPQDEHERLLADALGEQGVTVEWETRLTGLTQTAETVNVTLAGPNGEDSASFAYVAGCDGVHSAVREALGIQTPGGTYDRLYYVADVKPVGEMTPEFVFALDPDAFALRLPSRKGENERLIGFVPREAEARPNLRLRARERRAAAGDRGRRGELVLDLSRASPRRDPVPGGPLLPSGRRRPRAQPRRRAGNEHRHRRCGEPLVEAGAGCPGPGRETRCSTPTKTSGSASPAPWSPPPTAPSRPSPTPA